MKVTEGKLSMSLGELKGILTKNQHAINKYCNDCEEQTLKEIPEEKRDLIRLTINIKREGSSNSWVL